MSDKAAMILKELCAFLKPLVRKFDLVVSLERSGYRLLQMMEKECFDFELNHYPSRSIHLLDLKDKKLLLFDDVIATGHRLKEMANILRKKGAYVSTAVFAVLDTCLPEYRATYCCKEVGLKDYEDISNAISDYVATLDMPVETDHIQVFGSVEPNISYEALKKSLQSLGKIYEGLSLPEGYQLGLRYPTFPLPDYINLPHIAKDVFTHKIRIKYKEKGDTLVLPLSFPILQEGEGACDGQMTIEFCKKYASIFENVPHGSMLLCCYCVIYNSTRELLIDFFKRWKTILDREGCSFKLRKVTYEDARLIFNDESLESDIERNINQILNE